MTAKGPRKRQRAGSPPAPAPAPAQAPAPSIILGLPDEVLGLVLEAAFGSVYNRRLPFVLTCKQIYKTAILRGSEVIINRQSGPPDDWLRKNKYVTSVKFKTLVHDLTVLRGSAITSLDLRGTYLDCKLAGTELWRHLKGLPLTHLAFSCLTGDREYMHGPKLLVSLEGIHKALPDLRSLKCDQLEGDAELRHLQGLSLVSLNLAHSWQITSLEGLRGMNLTRLNISSCYKLTPSGISALEGMPLVELVFRGCMLDAHMATIALLAPTLVHLDLFNSGITDEGLRALRGVRLKTFLLKLCVNISAAGLVYLVDMPLELLDLRYTGIKLQDCPPNLRSVIRH